MSASIIEIDEYIELLKNQKEKEGITHVVLTTLIHGRSYAPSEKIDAYRVPFAFPGELFLTHDLRNIHQKGIIPCGLLLVSGEERFRGGLLQELEVAK